MSLLGLQRTLGKRVGNRKNRIEIKQNNRIEKKCRLIGVVVLMLLRDYVSFQSKEYFDKDFSGITP